MHIVGVMLTATHQCFDVIDGEIRLGEAVLTGVMIPLVDECPLQTANRGTFWPHQPPASVSERQRA